MTEKKLTFIQKGQEYDLYNLPKGFVIENDLNLSGRGLEKLPDLSTVTVLGNFYCSFNRLETLEGAPLYVNGNFYSQQSGLKSLKGISQRIGGNVFCDSNKINTFYVRPEEVGGRLYFDDNPVLKEYNLPNDFTLEELQTAIRNKIEAYKEKTRREGTDLPISRIIGSLLNRDKPSQR